MPSMAPPPVLDVNPGDNSPIQEVLRALLDFEYSLALLEGIPAGHLCEEHGLAVTVYELQLSGG